MLISSFVALVIILAVVGGGGPTNCNALTIKIIVRPKLAKDSKCRYIFKYKTPDMDEPRVAMGFSAGRNYTRDILFMELKGGEEKNFRFTGIELVNMANGKKRTVSKAGEKIEFLWCQKILCKK